VAVDRELLNGASMRGLLVLLSILVLAPERAEASGCFLGPFSITINPPLGCEVVVVSHAANGPTTFTVTARRGQQNIDVTGATTTSTTMLGVPYTNFACDGSVIMSYEQSEAYNFYRIALNGAAVGDLLSIDGIDTGYVQATGSCSEDVTKASPSCTGVNSGYPCAPHGDAGVGSDEQMHDPAGGCSAAGSSAGSSAGIILVLVMLYMLRPRR